MNVLGLLFENLPISKIHISLDIEPNIFKYEMETSSFLPKKEVQKLLRLRGFEFVGLEVLNDDLTFVFKREYNPHVGDVENILRELDGVTPTALITLTSIEFVTSRLTDEEAKVVLKILDENGFSATYKHVCNRTVFLVRR